MNQEEFVIFAELNRDHFDEILQSLMGQFKNVQSGRQGDDWIWIHLGEDRIEIDSFYSTELEVKGKRKHFTTAMQAIQQLDESWILQIYNPPKIDMTR